MTISTRIANAIIDTRYFLRAQGMNLLLALSIVAVLVGQFALVINQEAIPRWSWSLTTNLDEITVEDDDAAAESNETVRPVADATVTVADLVAVDMSNVGFMH